MTNIGGVDGVDGVVGVDESDAVSDAAASIWTTLVESLPRIGVAILVIVVGYLLSRLVRIVLKKLFTGSQTESFARVMSKLGGYILVFLFVFAGVVIAFPSVKPVDLLAGLGFISVAVGFAFQDILENTLSGVLLLFRQPFESGDQIEVQDHRPERFRRSPSAKRGSRRSPVSSSSSPIVTSTRT